METKLKHNTKQTCSDSFWQNNKQQTKQDKWLDSFVFVAPDCFGQRFLKVGQCKARRNTDTTEPHSFVDTQVNVKETTKQREDNHIPTPAKQEHLPVLTCSNKQEYTKSRGPATWICLPDRMDPRIFFTTD